MRSRAQEPACRAALDGLELAVAPVIDEARVRFHDPRPFAGDAGHDRRTDRVIERIAASRPPPPVARVCSMSRGCCVCSTSIPWIIDHVGVDMRITLSQSLTMFQAEIGKDCQFQRKRDITLRRCIIFMRSN